MKTWAAALKSHALSCRHLHRRVEIIQIKWLICQVMSSAADIKSLTSGTIPGSCQTSVRKLWAYLAVMQLVLGQDWKMESGQERQRLGGSPLLLPFEWKAGRWQCTDCCTETGGKNSQTSTFTTSLCTSVSCQLHILCYSFCRVAAIIFSSLAKPTQCFQLGL